MAIAFEKYDPAKHGDYNAERGGKHAPLLAPARDGGIVIDPEVAEAVYQGIQKLIDRNVERVIRRTLGPNQTLVAVVKK